jgi:hypothetical protein
MPLGELREILDDARGICPEVVGTVFVNKDAGLVVFILGIPTNVPALLDDGAPDPKLTRKPLGKNRSGKAGTDD